MANEIVEREAAQPDARIAQAAFDQRELVAHRLADLAPLEHRVHGIAEIGAGDRRQPGKLRVFRLGGAVVCRDSVVVRDRIDGHVCGGFVRRLARPDVGAAAARKLQVAERWIRRIRQHVCRARRSPRRVPLFVGPRPARPTTA